MAWHTLKRFWWATAALAATVLVHLVLYLLDPTRGNSTSFRLLGLAMGAAAFVTLLLPFVLTEARAQALKARLAGLRVPFLIASLALLGALGFVQRPTWIYAHFMLFVAWTVLVLYWTLYLEGGTSAGERRLWLALAGLALLVIVAARLVALSYAPPLHMTDEPWLISLSASYARTGTFNEGIIPDLSFAMRYFALLGHWFQLVGIGLYQGRLLSLLLIAAQGLLLYDAARRLFQDRTGLYALLLVAASAVVIVGARVRHDAPLALMIAVALWCYSRADHSESVSAWWWHLLGGVAVGLGAFAHYHASGFGLALLVGLYGPLWWQRWRQEGRWLPGREMIAFGLGGLLGFAVVLLVQILPFLGLDVSILVAPRNPQSVTAYFRGVMDHFGSIIHHSRLEAALLIATVSSALWHRQRLEVALALTALAMHLALALMSGPGYIVDYYVIPLLPVHLLLVARLLVRLGDLPRKPATTAAVLPLALLVLPLLGAALNPAWDLLRNERPVILPPPPPARWLLDNVPQEATIVGDHRYYLHLYNYDYVSPNAPYLNPYEPAPQTDEALFAFWDGFDVDYFIYDPTLSTAAPLRNLVQAGYLDSRDYEVVAEWGAVKIYSRDDSAPPSAGSP